MNKKEKLQLMANLNKYDITKQGNKYVVECDDMEYYFRTKKDAIRFGYFITLTNYGTDKDLKTQKISIYNGETDIQINLEDSLLDISLLIGIWEKEYNDCWYTFIDLSVTSGYEDLKETYEIVDINTFISLIEEDYAIKVNVDDLKKGENIHNINRNIDWWDLIEENGNVYMNGKLSEECNHDMYAMFNGVVVNA